MEKTKKVRIGDCIIELDIPEKTLNKGGFKENNVCAYDISKNPLWNIADLLVDFSNKHGLKYYCELFYDIQHIDESIIRCVGFYNHCEIDLEKNEIIRIINNK